MKAWVINKFGEPNIFEQIDLPVPKVLTNHVLIRVAASSVNPVDYKIRLGAVRDIAPDFPAILHADVAGVVEVRFAIPCSVALQETIKLIDKIDIAIQEFPIA